MPAPEASALSLAEDLMRVRAAADAEYRQRLGDLLGLVSHARAELEAGRVACLAGLPADAPAVRSALEWAGQLSRIIELAGFLVAKSAVLTGRWPADDEAEALALCADEDGLYAFVDAMERVPIGFVDPPIAVPAAH